MTAASPFHVYNHFETPLLVDAVDSELRRVITEPRPRRSLVRRVARAIRGTGEPLEQVLRGVPDDAVRDGLRELADEHDPRFLNGRWMPPIEDESTVELVEIRLGGCEVVEERIGALFELRWADGRHEILQDGDLAYASRLPLRPRAFRARLESGDIGWPLDVCFEDFRDRYGDPIPVSLDVYTEVLTDAEGWAETFEDGEEYPGFAVSVSNSAAEEDDDDADGWADDSEWVGHEEWAGHVGGAGPAARPGGEGGGRA